MLYAGEKGPSSSGGTFKLRYASLRYIIRSDLFVISPVTPIPVPAVNSGRVPSILISMSLARLDVLGLSTTVTRALPMAGDRDHTIIAEQQITNRCALRYFISVRKRVLNFFMLQHRSRSYTKTVPLSTVQRVYRRAHQSHP